MTKDAALSDETGDNGVMSGLCGINNVSSITSVLRPTVATQ